ncbi:MAG: choice-of-anchor L domain-containing protein [Lacipirellulaceae bacterium]
MLVRSLTLTLALSSSSAYAIPYLTIVGAGPASSDVESMADRLLDSQSSILFLPGSASTAINSTGAPTSNYRQFRLFDHGRVPVGTSLPTNQNPATPSQPAEYAGGIGIQHGVVLTTGFATDIEAGVVTPSAVGHGCEGPNNGYNSGTFDHFGEVSRLLQASDRVLDADFKQAVFPNEPSSSRVFDSSDPGVLSFRVTLVKPGFLRLRYVFASDEFPAFIRQVFNDSFCVLVRQEARAVRGYENLAVFRDPTTLVPPATVPAPMPFRLKDLVNCGSKLVRFNQVAPSFGTSSQHYITRTIEDSFNGVRSKYYDIEYGAFSAVLTCESSQTLAPGEYTIKLVVHDVADRKIDAALFVEGGSLKLFALQAADFNADGIVSLADYNIIVVNYGRPGASFAQGDANGDGTVGLADYTALVNSFGLPGDRDYRADFNRDGVVNGHDRAVWSASYFGEYTGIAKCANRFQGDADNDGDVDLADYNIWLAEYSQGGPGGGGGGSSATMAAGTPGSAAPSGQTSAETQVLDVPGPELSAAEWATGLGDNSTSALRLMESAALQLAAGRLPPTPDANDDGHVNAADVAAFEAMLAEPAGAGAVARAAD